MRKSIASKVFAAACSLLILCGTMFCPAAASASESDYVSFDEYYTAISAAAEEHGISCSSENCDESALVPRSFMENELSFLQSLPKDGVKAELSSVEIISDEPSTRIPMPVDKLYRMTWTVAPHADMWANINVDVNATIDAQYNSVMHVNSVSSYQIGTSINFESYTQTSASARWDSNKIYADVFGTVNFRNLLNVSFSAPCDLSYSWDI